MQKLHTQITHLKETHAQVWYWVGDEEKCFEGWVWINPAYRGTVAARLLRGRNNFRLCKLEDIISVKEVIS